MTCPTFRLMLLKAPQKGGSRSKDEGTLGLSSTRVPEQTLGGAEGRVCLMTEIKRAGIVKLTKSAASPARSKSESLELRLARVREMAALLREGTDTFTAKIEQAEAALQDLGLNLFAAVAIAPTAASESEHEDEILAFRKGGDRWGLFFGTLKNGKWTFTPLVNATRANRLRAVEHLDDLLDDLLENAETSLDQLFNGLNVTDRFLKLVREGVHS